MWRSCAERELRILSTPSPRLESLHRISCRQNRSRQVTFRNALEEMILWTKQGKLWQFPVDNEQGKSSGSHGSNLVVALVLKKKYVSQSQSPFVGPWDGSFAALNTFLLKSP